MADLSSILLDAYAHVHNGAPDPAPRAATLTRATLQAKRDALAQVEARCYVSRVQRQFLDRVLAEMP